MNRETARRVPQSIESLAEARITAAMKAGEFDRLPGMGAPLTLEDDSMIPPEWRMAFRLLKNAGLAPAWIEAGKEIDLAVDRLRAGMAALPSDASRKAEALRGFADQAADLNRRIALFNLNVPSTRWARSLLDVDKEIRRAGVG